TSRAAGPSNHCNGGEMLRPRILIPLALTLAAAIVPAVVRGDVGVGPGGGTPGTSLNFTLVGSNAPSSPGMNPAPAVFDRYVYIANRSDGANSCGDSDPGPGVVPVLTPANPGGTCTHVHPGILVVDIADPANPTIVGEFGNGFVTGSNVGQ